MEAKDCTGATLRHNCTGGPSVVCCIFDSNPVPSIPDGVLITQEVFYRMAGYTARTRALYPFYVQALTDANIRDFQEATAFTAQVI